jgi:hypothetical protein
MGITYNPGVVSSGLVFAVDGGNRKSYSQNVFPYPLDGYSWGTSGFQMTVSRDTSTSSPVGNSPLKLVTLGTSAYTNTYNSLPFTLSPAAQGQTWTFSFWVKGSSSFSASMLIFESNSSGNYTAYGQPYYNVTTEWTRVSGSYTMTQATTTGVQVRIDCYVNGVTLWVDGFQLEAASSASSFNSIPNTNGTTWRDLIGNGNTGTLVNGVGYNSSNLGSLVFDGVNDFVLLPTNATFGNNTTWEAWIYSTGNASTYNMFMGRYLPYFGFYTGNGLIFSNLIGGSQSTIYTSGLSLNTWYHTTFTTSYDGVNTTMKIYTNGVETATGTFSGSQGNYSNPFMIGDGNNGSNGSWYPFIGRISNVKIYNKTLSTTEVQQNFQAQRTRFGI